MTRLLFYYAAYYLKNELNKSNLYLFIQSEKSKFIELIEIYFFIFLNNSFLN